MTVLEILRYPDARLKEVAEEVREFDSLLKKLLDDMAATMYAAQGIGLAATQVGVGKRVVVVDLSAENSERIDLVNPKIVWSEGRASSEEGCLSIPGYRDYVPRSEKVVVEAQDPAGKEFEVKAEKLFAYCLQHEIDHLNGVLFIDRLSRLKRELFKRWHKKSLSEE